MVHPKGPADDPGPRNILRVVCQAAAFRSNAGSVRVRPLSQVHGGKCLQQGVWSNEHVMRQIREEGRIPPTENFRLLVTLMLTSPPGPPRPGRSATCCPSVSESAKPGGRGPPWQGRLA